MPFILVFAGILLIVAGVQNTQGQLFALLKQDFAPNSQSFWPWILAIAVIGGIGYIRPLRPITTPFFILVVLALLLANGGFFSKLQSAFTSGSGALPGIPPLPSIGNLLQGFGTSTP